MADTRPRRRQTPDFRIGRERNETREETGEGSHFRRLRGERGTHRGNMAFAEIEISRGVLPRIYRLSRLESCCYSVFPSLSPSLSFSLSMSIFFRTLSIPPVSYFQIAESHVTPI